MVAAAAGGAALLAALAAYFIVHRKRRKRQRAVPAGDDVPLMELQTMEPEYDDDFSDDEDTVVFEHKGKEYLRDLATNDIFDYVVFMDGGDVEAIGIYNPDTDNIELHDDECGLEPQGPLLCAAGV